MFKLKDHFVLEILTFLSWLFGYVEKWLVKNIKGKFKIYDFRDGTINTYNVNIGQYLKKECQAGNEIWSFNKI